MQMSIALDSQMAATLHMKQLAGQVVSLVNTVGLLQTATETTFGKDAQMDALYAAFTEELESL